MTRVAGLEEFLVDLGALSQGLQLRFAASAAVVELPNSAKQGQKLLNEIVLQARGWWMGGRASAPACSRRRPPAVVSSPRPIRWALRCAIARGSLSARGAARTRLRRSCTPSTGSRSSARPFVACSRRASGCVCPAQRPPANGVVASFLPFPRYIAVPKKKKGMQQVGAARAPAGGGGDGDGFLSGSGEEVSDDEEGGGADGS